MTDQPTEALLAEQVRYYRERANEYDATSPDVAPGAVAALQALGPFERVIELGAGTGQYTGILVSMAQEVIAVDTSPEVLAINRAKNPAPNMTTLVADVFDDVPLEPADLVFFAALWSHIPMSRFETFWERVERLLAPGGRVFMVDESRHDLWREEDTDVDGVVGRTLSDGRRFRIVKVLWDPTELSARLAAIGLRARLTREDPFYWGVIERAT
jgi:SAM-dependent methyltransferase